MTSSPTRMRALCVGFSLAALLAGIAHGYMSVRFAQRLTVDEEGWWVQGGSVVIVSLIGALLAATAGVSASRKTFWGVVGAILTMAAAALFVGYTASNSMGYTGFQVYSKTKPIELKNKQAKDIADLQNETAIKERQQLHDVMIRTYVTAKQPKDKATALADIEELGQKPVPLKEATPAEVAIVDPRAEVAKNLFGVDMDKAQALSIAALPILLIVGEILGPFLSTLLWPYSPHENNPRLRVTLRQLSAVEARSDVLADVAKSREFCITEYADRWGINKGQVSRWFDDWQAQGHIKQARRGRRIVAVAPKSNVVPIKGSGVA